MIHFEVPIIKQFRLDKIQDLYSEAFYLLVFKYSRFLCKYSTDEKIVNEKTFQCSLFRDSISKRVLV